MVKLTIHFGDISRDRYDIPYYARYFPETNYIFHYSEVKTYHYGYSAIREIAEEIYKNSKITDVYTASEYLINSIILLNMKDTSDTPREVCYIEHFNKIRKLDESDSEIDRMMFSEEKIHHRIEHSVDPVTRAIIINEEDMTENGLSHSLLGANARLESEIYYLKMDRTAVPKIDISNIEWMDGHEPEEGEEP
jgi:hypothetical protein